MHYAITDKAGPVAIYSSGQWQSNSIATRSGEGSVTVPGMPLDELIEREKIRRVDFLKMNIEGAERFALPGCWQALARTRFVCVAAHDFRALRGEGAEFRTLAFVREFLSSCGFDLVTRDADPRYYVPYHVHGRR